MAAARVAPLGVYVHWPYCHALCTYCNFNKYVTPTDASVAASTAAALATAVQRQRERARHTHVPSGSSRLCRRSAPYP